MRKDRARCRIDGVWSEAEARPMIEADRAVQKKEELSLRQFLISSGGRTRTSDLRVMSPTSYQLLYPAVLLDCKYSYYFNKYKTFFALLIPVNPKSEGSKVRVIL